MNDGPAQIAVVVLAATFAWAGTMKAMHAERWRLDVRVYRLPRPVRAFAFIALPWVEIGIAVALVGGRPRAGASVALVLLGAFCIAIARARILLGTNTLSCGCFGGTSARDYRLLLLRNLALGMVAAYVLLAIEAGSEPRVIPGGDGLVALLMAVLGVTATAWVIHQISARAHEPSGTGA